MSADAEHPSTPLDGRSPVAGGAGDQRDVDTTVGPPRPDDGAELWRVARDTAVLDVNSVYAYLIWCRCFADTTTVARAGDRVVGFITGYRRPPDPATLFVWQVAVDTGFRGRNLAGRMLQDLADRTGCTWVETTVTPDNEASIAMFTAFARDRAAQIDRSDLFAPADFVPGGTTEGMEAHEPEDLYRIGPLRGGTSPGET